ncbi:unnamed protein product [Phaedon cochleariae]|uniref:Ectopic P granules protein 5 homolog n=1 Tax=Phaedon cochleariae TaxID=80249 RepID=A0A9N9X4R9_PHACE|nr:unnamed protein product [Phaedon cochleariae]
MEIAKEKQQAKKKKKPRDKAEATVVKVEKDDEKVSVSNVMDSEREVDSKNVLNIEKDQLAAGSSIINQTLNSTVVTKITEHLRDQSEIIDLSTSNPTTISKDITKNNEKSENKPVLHAEVEGHNEFSKLLDKSKELINIIKLTEISEIEVPKVVDAKPHVPSVIKPYTEEQLSALYHNGELETVDAFISQYVEAELKGTAIIQHKLYHLLKTYLRLKEKITGNTLELDQIRKEYVALQKDLWTIESATVTGKGECQDGTVVTTSHSYNKSIFHRSVFQSIIRILGNVQKLTYENHTLYAYSAEEVRLQIELYLQSVMLNCMNVTQLDRNAPVALTLQAEPQHLAPYFGELRICISILFAFQRMLIREVEFVKETRTWLKQLIAILLRVANYQDHLFILNHVLRCPAGVSNWASCFVQTPLASRTCESPFANLQINHVLTILATILTPIRERERFLEDIAQGKEMAGEALWVLVDSDGEEDENIGVSLKENDLVGLLNQLPLDELFRNVLLIQHRDYQDFYDVTSITEHHVLRYFAFSTVLLRILYKGIQTYDQPRYNQFSKRLSRFIRHVAQYATDQWEQFLKVQNVEDKAMLDRLQVEYDAFFLRAIHYLYSAHKPGAWQFLAVIPYHMVSAHALWRIFRFLHSLDSEAQDILRPRAEEDALRPQREEVWERKARGQFEEKLAGLEDGEVYYLLNTFANMALARGDGDMEFIFAATMDLLEVGFVSEATQESCSKSSRILLTHITSKHPHLLTNILKVVKENMDKIGPLALYLYEELPLSIWKITENDMEMISRLLLNHNSVSSNENKLSRMILSRLDWDKIPYEIHCDVAILVVNAVFQNPAMENWAWQTILRLKLHINDKAFKEIGRVQEVEMYDTLMKGLREQNTLAIFVTILMTTWGHLVPLICTKGFSQLVYLQTQEKHEAVLFALFLLVPLFIDSQECIINLEKFQEIIQNLLGADRGYISMAKSLVYAQNTVLQQFGNMVEAQISNFAYYDLDSPRCLVRLWTNALVSLPGWNKDVGVLYLLDVIVRTAFLHADALDVVSNILRDQQQCGTPQENSGTISSLFKWVSNNNVNGSLIPNSLANNTWLAYLMISVEHEERELHTGLWNEVLVQLGKQKGKINVDQAIKKAASVVKCPSFTSGYLCVFRWAQQALDTSLDHPLLPLLWQNFFCLYLARIPTASVTERSCVGEKFFDGLVNFAFLKRIKRRLQESVDYFQSKLDVKDEENDELDKKQFYQGCRNVFRAFLLWLEEPRLQENNILLKSLPPQYDPALLATIMLGSKTPWYQFIDYEKIKKEQQLHVRIWRINNFREKTNVNQPLLNAGSRVESDDPVERILRRLTSYDCPKPAPDIVISAPVIPIIEFGGRDEMFKSLEQSFKKVKQSAHSHALKLSEHKALDSAFKELIPQLYRSVLHKIKKSVPCKGKNQTVHCSGSAVIILEMQEARINERIEHQVQLNRNTYESLLTDALQPASLNLCSSAVTIRQSIKMLQSQLQCNPATAELGVELFYYILSLMNEEMNAYPPTKTLFSTCLENLGQSHICGVEYEMPRLLQKILKEPNCGQYLAPHFCPSNVGSANLLLMYSTICKEMGQKYDIAFALLSKFEIDNWLNNKTPKLSQRSQFIQSVIKALTTLGFEPPTDSSTLHGLYRKHLLTVFEHQFPEHYGEILLHLLKGSTGNPESNLLALSVWMDVLNSLARPVVLNIKSPLRDQLRQYAQNRQVLQHQELLETAELLSKHFTQERLQYGIYGLYPKCRNYMDVFVILLGLIGHGIIVSMIDTHQGLLGDKLCEKIWPCIRDMFAPWLVPYSMQNLKENMASWIQQLADDRTVLLPWISADVSFAQKTLGAFRECISFVIHTLPASSSILSYIWQWYVACYAHSSVKDHILLPVHQTFLTFPWYNFWPSVVDVECMLKVVEQYLPECHSFLGHIFMSVSWSNWLNNFSNAPAQLKSRVYQCFISLVVKLCNEPNVRKNYADQAKSVLAQAENFDWTVLDVSFYQHVMDWFVMSCDSSVIFRTDPLDLDYRVLHFLKTVALYKTRLPVTTSDTLPRRLIYVKTYTKLLSVYSNRHKNNVQRKEQEIFVLVSRQLNDLECVVEQAEEMTVLLAELEGILNIDNIELIALKSFTKWIENKTGNGIIVSSLLKSLGMAVRDPGILAELLEVTITSYFMNTISDEFEPTWREVSGLLTVLASKQTELERALLSKGCLLTLNAIFVQRISNCNDVGALLNLCLDWMVNTKINESTEPKMPLIWCGLLMLVSQHSEKDEQFCAVVLHKFAQILLQTSEDKGGSRWGRGLLTAIGLSKQANLSLNFKFLCRALAGYLLAQLPEMKGEPQVIRRVPNASARVGQAGGNTECVKVLLTLDFGQSQGKIKESAELALKQIQDASNSLHNARKFVMLLVKQFYTKPYLKDIG